MTVQCYSKCSLSQNAIDAINTDVISGVERRNKERKILIILNEI